MYFERTVINFCQVGEINHQARTSSFSIHFSGFIERVTELLHSREIQIGIGFDDNSFLCDFVSLHNKRME